MCNILLKESRKYKYEAFIALVSLFWFTSPFGANTDFGLSSTFRQKDPTYRLFLASLTHFSCT